METIARAPPDRRPADAVQPTFLLILDTCRSTPRSDEAAFSLGTAATCTQQHLEAKRCLPGQPVDLIRTLTLNT